MPAPSPSDRLAAVRARDLVQRQWRTPTVAGRTGPVGTAGARRGASGTAREGRGAVAPRHRHRHRAGPPPRVHETLQRLEDRLPPGLRAVRWRVGSRTALGALLVTASLLVVAGALAWLTWPGGAGSAVAPGQPVPVRAGGVGTAGGASAAAAGAEPGGPEEPGTVAEPAASSAASVPVVTTAAPSVVVHVVGEVASPGLVTLPVGSRVADALTSAGGASGGADLSALNLARPLVDGEQVLVPQPGQSPAAPAGAVPEAPAGAPAGPLDLNAASAEQLDALPGVGQVLAGRVLAWRQENGRFTSVEELGEVRGIGPALLEGLRDLVRV